MIPVEVLTTQGNENGKIRELPEAQEGAVVKRQSDHSMRQAEGRRLSGDGTRSAVSRRKTKQVTEGARWREQRRFDDGEDGAGRRHVENHSPR